MNTNKLKVIALLTLLQSFFLGSCVLDSKPMGYCVKNCTEDTLLIDLSESDTLDDGMYCDLSSKDTVGLISDDTTSLCIKDKKIVIFNYYRVMPKATSKGFFSINRDTFYLYAIKWNIARKYALETIRKKKLYDRRVVTYKDFNYNRMFEYK